MIVKKITVTPVLGVADAFMDGETFSPGELPFEVGPGVYIADVHEQMKDLDYSLWARRYLSKEDVKQLQHWRYALVHYFEAEEYMTSSPEEASRALVQQVFVGLRIVRPSSVPYQYVRAVVRPDGSFDPGGFSKAEGRLSAPSCDAANSVRPRDAQLLRAIVPTLLRAYETDCRPVTGAIRILELGYIAEFPDVKQLMWTTGLDALFTSARNWGSDIASRRIMNFLGPDTRIYEPGSFPSYLAVPSLTVKDVLLDVYRLRNKFAHGEWIPKEFLDRPGYIGKAGESLNYADVLLEATSIILRMGLIQILRENQLEIFGTKDALDWHFSRVRLLAKEKNRTRGVFRHREPSVH
jgi:hypothetical protein